MPGSRCRLPFPRDPKTPPITDKKVYHTAGVGHKPTQRTPRCRGLPPNYFENFVVNYLDARSPHAVRLLLLTPW
jgi:hypothetical protein